MSEPETSGWYTFQRIGKALVTPITLLILVGILIYGAWWGYQAVTAPAPTPEPTPCQTKPASELKSSEVSVRVLNGGFTSGLARKVSKNLESKGFDILRIGNTDERIKETVIVGKDTKAPEVQLVAKFFKKASVKADNRVDGTVDVLVGSEFGGMEMKAPVSIKVPGGVVCLPASPTPSPSTSPSTAPTPTKAPSKKAEN